MLTEAMIARVLASPATSAAKGVALAKGKELLARFNSDERFQVALAEEREQILWTLHTVAIAVARCVSGCELDGGVASAA